MAIVFHLAMTATEFSSTAVLPPHMGWLACHFSSSGPGLSNIPKALPADSVLMLDDSIPFHEHHQNIIIEQLMQAVTALDVQAVVLDLQRPNIPEVRELTVALQKQLPCPVAAPPGYTGGGPVFLPPVPVHQPLSTYLAPYKGRQLWLEVALDGIKMHITGKGCHSAPYFCTNAIGFPHRDTNLHCHYRIVQTNDEVDFYLQRTADDLFDLLEEAERLGVTQAVGLWQELNRLDGFVPDARLPKQRFHDRISPSNMFEL